MLDLTLFRIRPFTGGTLATFLNALARGCVLLVMTSYLQGPTMNLIPLAAGIFLLPISAAVTVCGPISGWLSDRGSPRLYATLGLLVTFVGFLWLAQIGPTADFVQVSIPMILIGSGEGIFSSPNRSSVMSSVPAQHRGVGGSVNTIMLNVGNTFSRAFAFLIMGLVLPTDALQNIFAGTANLSGGAAFVSQFIGSLHLVFYVCAAFVAASIVPSILRGSGSAGAREQPSATASSEPESPLD